MVSNAGQQTTVVSERLAKEYMSAVLRLRGPDHTLHTSHH